MSEVLALSIIGAASGALITLAALGLIVIYRGSGVLNLAGAAIGTVGVFVFADLRSNGTPYLVALLVGVIVSGVCSALTYCLVILPLRRASNISRLIGTLAVLAIIQAALTIHYGPAVRLVPSGLPSGVWHIGRTGIGEDKVILLGIGIALSAILYSVYRYTRFGLATSAVAENELAASALGLSPMTIAGCNWFLGGALGGLSGILLAPIIGLQINAGTAYLVPALAAALLGGMSSFPLTLLGGIVVGVGQAQMSRYVHSPGWSSAVPFLLILVVLAFRGRGLLSRPGVEERRPGIGTGRIRVIPLLIACATVVVAVYAGLSTEYVSAIALTFAVAVILLSTVVVTGYAGQLSLCQFTFAGFGAWFAGMFFTRVGMPYLAALVLAVILAFPLGFVVGLPALRTRGIQLAVATLGVAAAVQSVLWLNYDLTGQSGFPIRNPTLFGIEIDTFDHPKNYAVVCVVGFLVAVVAVSNLRRGASGRRLIALRSNERAAAANGINPYVAKLYAFALSSSIAAFGGVLFEFRNTTLVYDSGFDPFSSITGLLYVVLGGVGQLSGPIVGAVGQPAGVIQTAIGGGGNVPLWIAVVGGILTARALADAPNGAAALFGTIWHKVVKLVPRVFRRAPTAAVTPDTVADQPEQAVEISPKSLRAEGIVLRYGNVVAVDDLSFALRPGEIVGLIGPNGAGKTSAVDALTGFVRPSKGRVWLEDTEITSWSVSRRAQAGMRRSFQSLELFEDLTISDNLRVAADRNDLGSFALDLVHPRRQLLTPHARAALQMLDLERDLERRPGELPYGRRRLVAIARALAGAPSVLCLDEPAAGLNSLESRELGELLRRVVNQWQIAVLLIEHDVDLVMNVCDRVLVLDYGHLIASGTPAEVRENEAVIASYLGTGGIDPRADADDGVSEPDSRQVTR